MTELVIGLISAVVSWAITHAYYKRSSVNVPEWAKPIIERLPEAPPSRDQLIDLFHEALQDGELIPDPNFGYVACPRCKAPSTEFDTHEQFDEEREDRYLVVRCKRCGWSDFTEL